MTLSRSQMKGRVARFAALGILAVAMSIFGFAGSTRAQTYAPLYSFGVIDATQNGPAGALAQGADGNMYGEVNGDTTKFYSITPGGGESLVWDSTQLNDGAYVCLTGMTVGTDQLLYGTCSLVDNNESASGGIFKYDPSQGQNGFTLLYSWPHFGEDASELPNQLILGPDGNFYGTTRSDFTNPNGTVYRITPSRTYTTLHVFQGSSGNDGQYPSEAPLLLASDGNLYGTTDAGGRNGLSNGGTIYRISLSGTLKILFDVPDGYGPLVGLTQGQDGNLYGQTGTGGNSDDGLIYQLSTSGKVKVLHQFNQSADSAAGPSLALTAGTDGNLYGASADDLGGGFGPESLYSVTPSGQYTDLFNGFGAPPFCLPAPVACLVSSPLLQYTNGIFYSVTQEGGEVGRGEFYSLANNLQPFVRLQLPVGKVGQTIGLFGQGFTTASSVKFNGTSASYSVVSDTYMTATVPQGATAGYVIISESSGSLRSNLPFNPKQ